MGKQAEDDHYTAAENISRKKLEVEIQADETSERKERREVGREGCRAAGRLWVPAAARRSARLYDNACLRFCGMCMSSGRAPQPLPHGGALPHVQLTSCPADKQNHLTLLHSSVPTRTALRQPSLRLRV